MLRFADVAHGVWCSAGNTLFGRWARARRLATLSGAFDDELISGIIQLLMRIDANVQLLLDVLTEEDGGDEEPEA